MTKNQLIDYIIKQAKTKNTWQFIYFKQDDRLFQIKMFEKWIQIFKLKNVYTSSGTMFNKTYKDLRLELDKLLDRYADQYPWEFITESTFINKEK